MRPRDRSEVAPLPLQLERIVEHPDGVLAGTRSVAKDRRIEAGEDRGQPAANSSSSCESVERSSISSRSCRDGVSTASAAARTVAIAARRLRRRARFSRGQRETSVSSRSVRWVCGSKARIFSTKSPKNSSRAAAVERRPDVEHAADGEGARSSTSGTLAYPAPVSLRASSSRSCSRLEHRRLRRSSAARGRHAGPGSDRADHDRTLPRWSGTTRRGAAAPPSGRGQPFVGRTSSAGSRTTAASRRGRTQVLLQASAAASSARRTPAPLQVGGELREGMAAGASGQARAPGPCGRRRGRLRGARVGRRAALRLGLSSRDLIAVVSMHTTASAQAFARAGGKFKGWECFRSTAERAESAEDFSFSFEWSKPLGGEWAGWPRSVSWMPRPRRIRPTSAHGASWTGQATSAGDESSRRSLRHRQGELHAVGRARAALPRGSALHSTTAPTLLSWHNARGPEKPSLRRWRRRPAGAQSVLAHQRRGPALRPRGDWEGCGRRPAAASPGADDQQAHRDAPRRGKRRGLRPGP